MRLAILGSRGFPSTYGGYETLVRYVARDWATQGHEVSVYCRDRKGRRHTWDVDGVRCIWTPGVDTKSLSTLSFGATAHAHALTQAYDAVLVLNIANGFYLPFIHTLGIPSVVNTDGLEWRRGKWSRSARRIFYQGAKMVAKYADVVVADSIAIGRIWEQEFGVTSRYIPYGAPVIEYPGEKRITPLGLEPDTYVLVVARLIPENNVELALDAVGLADNAIPMVVVGTSNDGGFLEARLRDLSERGQVRWLGHVHDQDLLTELWANAGLYIHGHSVGGTNPALLQALGAGAPTIALDTEFNREVIESDDQLFKPDAKLLAQRIMEVLGSPTAKRRFQRHGQTVIAERYSWDDVSRAYLEALRDAQGKRRQ